MTGIKGFDNIIKGIIKKYGDIIEGYNYDCDGYEISLKEGNTFDCVRTNTLFSSTLKDLRDDVKQGINNEGRDSRIFIDIEFLKGWR